MDIVLPTQGAELVIGECEQEEDNYAEPRQLIMLLKFISEQPHHWPTKNIY